MSTLTAREKARLEKLFNMGGGYVLHFSDSTFATFFYDVVDIDIHAQKYCSNGTSKAKKLREFWRLESDYLVGKVTQAMIEEAEAKLFSSSSYFSAPDAKEDQEREKLIKSCHEIVKRLLSGQEGNEAKKYGIEQRRKALILQVDILLSALQENIDSASGQRNMPPAFDLALHEDIKYVEEIRRLVKTLQETKDALHEGSVHQHSLNTPSLAKEALREFVLKLSGAAGEGIGRTVTWGTRIALAWFAIGILKDFGVSVDKLMELIQPKVPLWEGA